MAKLDPQQNVYYPSKAKTKDLHDDFRILFNHVYELRRQVKDLHGKLSAMQPPTAQGNPGGPSSTKIAGFNVRGVPPNNNDRLTFDATSGDITWKP